MKVIDAEFIKNWAIANSVHSMDAKNIYVVSYEKLVEVISKNSLDAPAAADLPGGLLDSLKRIAEMKDRDGNVIDMTAQELQGIARRAIACHEATSASAAAEVNADGMDQCVEFWAGKNAILVLEKAWLEAAFEDIQKLVKGSMVLKTGTMAGDFAEMDIGWNNALNMVLNYMQKKLPQLNTRAAGGGSCDCEHDFGVDAPGDIVRCQICGLPRALAGGGAFEDQRTTEYDCVVSDIKAQGHTDRCAKRIVYGDGCCECKPSDTLNEGETP